MKKIFLWGCLAWLVLVQMGCSDRHEDITFPDDGVIRYLVLWHSFHAPSQSGTTIIYCYGLDLSYEGNLAYLIPLAKENLVATINDADPDRTWGPNLRQYAHFVADVSGLGYPSFVEDNDGPDALKGKKRYSVGCSLDEDGQPIVKGIHIYPNANYPEGVSVTDRKWIDDVEQSQTRTLTFQKIEASTWKDVRAASRAAWEAYEQKMITH